MDPKEKQAFIQSYSNNVAHYCSDEVSAFIDAYHAEGADQNKVYDEHACYTSVLDCFGVWSDALSFAKQQFLRRFTTFED